MNAEETVIGPEGTETIVSVHEAIAAGYSFICKTKDEVIMSKNGRALATKWYVSKAHQRDWNGEKSKD